MWGVRTGWRVEKFRAVVSDTAEVPLVDKRNRQDGDSGAPNTAEVPLACKRNRQDGVSGATFQTTPVMKLLNTRRVRGQRYYLSNNTR
jgi:hypothetical protein